MEVIEDRHGRRSTLIASQLPTEHWHDYIGEATLARCAPPRGSMRKLPSSWVTESKIAFVGQVPSWHK